MGDAAGLVLSPPPGWAGRIRIGLATHAANPQQAIDVIVDGQRLFEGWPRQGVLELTVPARPYCERLKDEGILCKETRGTVIRLAPPLVITKDEIDWAIGRLRMTSSSSRSSRPWSSASGCRSRS